MQNYVTAVDIRYLKGPRYYSFTLIIIMLITIMMMIIIIIIIMDAVGLPQ
jgi:hypothetical protein